MLPQAFINIAFFLLPVVTFAMVEPIGVIGQLDGSAYIHAKNKQKVSAKLRMKLYIHDTLRTENSSRLTVQLNDGSFLKLGDNTVILFNGYQNNTENKQRHLSLKFVQGALAVTPGTAEHMSSSFKISTEQAIINSQNTPFWVGNLNNYSLDVITLKPGNVLVLNDKAKVLLQHPYYGTTIYNNDMLPTPTVKWSQDKLHAVSNSVG